MHRMQNIHKKNEWYISSRTISRSFRASIALKQSFTVRHSFKTVSYELNRINKLNYYKHEKVLFNYTEFSTPDD